MKEQNNYKQILTQREMEKKGQTTIFIIVAILIVVLGILIYLFYPEISAVVTGEIRPNTFLLSCVEPEITRGMELLSKQGGYSDPEGFIWHDGNKVKYLCYTSQYYLPCKVQQPMIKKHLEQELNAMVKNKVGECVRDMKTAYERRGYTASLSRNVNSDIEITLNGINVKISAPMTITKDDTTQSFEDFNILKTSKMYSLLMITHSIIDYESTYGDSETLFYTAYYPSLKIQKTKLGDGSTIYTVSDVVTKESFTFASRSVAWPSGYGLTT